MSRWISLWWVISAIMLAGCSSSEQPHRVQSLAAPTLTPSLEPASLPAPTFSPAPAVFPTLATFTASYTNAVSLLDGICFEYLSDMNGQTWLWATPEELTAFYDQVDSSQRCSQAVARGTLDFNGYVLAGVVSSGTGCDAAHRVLNLTQDDTMRTQILTLEFDLLPGCPYELVEPFLIAVPPPPEGYRFSITITSP